MAEGTEIAKAYVQIIPSAKGIKGSLPKVLGGETASAGKTIGESLTSAIKKVIVAAGIGKMVSSALTEGANLQQSIGGVETLFKDSADTMKAYAAEAYKTAGVSANEYMEQATSFSASLLQGLGGDTTAAAEYANRAIVDMSDNANKMGSDITSIQNAYQGFAKQNYTMLDNLKLGYGGTKEEMQRLISDAAKMTDVQEKLGVSVDANSMSFDNIINAISVMQEHLDIAGTTSIEAAETFSGSLASMKAAAKNLLANLTLGEDIAPSLVALGDTVFTFVKGNLIPMVGNLLQGLPETLNYALSTAVRGVNLVANNADAIVSQGTELVGEIAASIISAAPYLVEAALKLAVSFGSALLTADWAGMAGNLISGIRSNLDQAAREILGTDGNIVASVADSIKKNLPSVLKEGVSIITNIADGILQNLPMIITVGGEMVSQFLGFVMDCLPDILEAGVDLILSLVQGISDNLPAIVSTAASVVANFLATIVQHLPDFLRSGIELLGKFKAGLLQAIPTLVHSLPQIFSSIRDAFASYDWLALGTDVLNGIKSGITGATGMLLESIQNVCADLLGTVKGFFGINSPSTVMAEQGGYLVEGMVNGVLELPGQVATIFEDLLGRTITFGKDMLLNAAQTGISFGQNLMLYIKQLPGQIWTQFSGALSRAATFLVNMKSRAVEIGSAFLQNLMNYLCQLPGQAWTQFFETISRAATFVVNMASKGLEAGKGFASRIKESLSGLPGEMENIGSNIVSGIWNGISGGWDWLTSKVKNLAKSLLDAAKDALGIESPSTEFRDEVGRWIPPGIAEGVERSKGVLSRTMDQMLYDATKSAHKDIQIGISGKTGRLDGNAVRSGGWVQNITIYSPTALSPYETARQTRNATRNMILSMRRT